MPNWKSESSALKKVKPKSELYSWHNNIELSGIPNDIPEDNLEKVVIDICHDSDVEIEPKDIEGCHRLPVSRYSRDSNKSVIVKFVNRKHPEAMLRNKRSISNKDFSHLNVLFALTTGISGVSAKTYKEEGKSIKSFALWRYYCTNAAVQGKYFMNVIYLILILMMYKKFKLDFVL